MRGADPGAPALRRAWQGARRAALACALTALGGCGDDAKPQPASPDGGAAIDASAPPPPPELGEMLDRRGRPLAAELVTLTLAAGPLRDAERTRYQRATEDLWPTFAGPMADALGFLDAIDGLTTSGDGCGNQQLGARRSYAELAALLVDDRLYLDAATGTCQRYLAIERAGGTPSGDCGGLGPRHDAVDETYSALIRGVAPPPVGDGVGPHADVSKDNFPFFAAPVRTASPPCL